MQIDYKIIYSDRKTLSIIVERDRSITVRAPHRTTKKQIEKALNRKKLWLYEKINHIQKYPKKVKQKEFVSGENVMYLGRNYKLDVSANSQDGIHFNQRFTIAKQSRITASELFRNWYIEKAHEKIVPKAKFYAKQLGVNYNKIMILNLKMRWGSCTLNNNLNFNWRLIKAPMYVIDYIIVHELTHLIESNHTEKFWNIVSIQVPRYEKAKKWLRQFGNILEVDFQ